jgi:hypothetical protein
MSQQTDDQQIRALIDASTFTQHSSAVCLVLRTKIENNSYQNNQRYADQQSPAVSSETPPKWSGHAGIRSLRLA